MTPLVFEKFIRAVKAYNLLERGDRIVVAVSGGADSVALLSLLVEIRSRFELDLIVAHLNHNLRGKSSDEDEEFVRALAERHGTRFVCERIPDEAVAARRENLENWARLRRYAFLNKTASTAAARSIALGHTMSDQAETFLMHLFRGSGSAGLSSMAYRREKFIRPLLSIERNEILQYLKLRRIAWREDSSNLDTQFLRNRLRQEIIPTLQERCNPKLVPLLAGAAAILRDENQALQSWAADVFDREASVGSDSITWDVKTLVSLPLALKRRLVCLSLGRLTSGKWHPSASRVGSILDLLGESQSGKSVQAGTLRCTRDFDRLVFEVVSMATPLEGFSYTLEIPGWVELTQADTSFEARFEPSEPLVQDSVVLNRWELSLTEPELKSGFLVRNWQPRDVYFPPDGGSPKNVAEMLKLRKISKRARASWPVVVLAGRIVCVKDFPFYADNTVQAGENTVVVVEERHRDQ